MKRRAVGQLALAGVALAALIAAFALLPIGGWLEALVQQIRGTGAVGLAAFSAILFGTTLVLVPTVELFVASGMIYGVFWGSVLSLVVSLAAALVAFGLGRTVLRDRVKRIAARHRKVADVDHALGEHAFSLAMLIRVSPAIPLGPTNYALAAAPISWRMYTLTAVLGMLPGHVLWAYLGSALHSVSQLGHAAHGVWPQILLWASIVATLAASVIIGRVVQRVIARAR